MKKIEQAVAWLVTLVYPLAIYYWIAWSRLYRWCHKGVYAGIVIRSCLTPHGAQRYMDTLPWVPDTWEQLWDVAGNPEKFQKDVILKATLGITSVGPRDCDDFACWAASAVDALYKPRVLTVCYQIPGKVFPRGHVICYVEIGGEAYHIGNWGMRGPLATSYEAVARSVATEKKAELLAYAVLDKDLDVLSIERV